MIGKLFSSSSILKYNLGYCKIYDTKYNNLPCSKLSLKSELTEKYELFKNVRHRNIMEIYKISQKSIYTKPVVPLVHFIEKDKIQYSKYIISRLKEVIKYIHTFLNKEHNALSIDSIFLDEMGEVYLGNFEKVREFESEGTDSSMLENLCVTLIGSQTLDVNMDENTIFDLIFETRTKPLNLISSGDKLNLMKEILISKSHITNLTSKYVFKIFIEDLKRDNEKSYKIFLIDSLRDLDDQYFFKCKLDLFSIIDSNVRMHLLEIFDGTEEDLNDICKDLSLGLRVKEKILKEKTINFIFNNNTQFNTISMDFLLISMEFCAELESIKLICNHLLKYERNDNYKSIYKLLQAFLSLDKNVLELYRCVEKFFVFFDKIKITKIILPNLCSKLIEKENQDFYFSLVEKILDFLKHNRDDIAAKDWSFRNIKSIFSKKQDNLEITNGKKKTCFENELNEWEEEDLKIK